VLRSLTLALLIPLLAAAACRGPSLADAVPRRARVPTLAAVKEEAPRRSLEDFLRPRGERPDGTALDLDRAIGTLLDAEARARERTPGNPGDACTDALDRYACERGLSRDAARLQYKNTRYKQPPVEPQPKR